MTNGVNGQGPPVTIRDFDTAITAPRWGYKDVNAYYNEASPLGLILKEPSLLPPVLFLHSIDDPWVPAKAVSQLLEMNSCSLSFHKKVILP